MTKDFLSEFKNNKNFKKQTKNMKTAPNKKKKVHYNKTVQITESVYKELRLYSFKNDITMGKIATDSIKHYLDNHKV